MFTNASGSKRSQIRTHFLQGRIGLKMQPLFHHQNSFLNETIMSCLFEFPSDLLVNILAYWCDIKSIVLIDSATCNAFERNLLLLSYHSEGFVINNNFNEYVYHCSYLSRKLRVIKWIHFKQIKLYTLTINGLCGVGPVATQIIFQLNTKAIIELSFSIFPILQGTSTYISAIRKQFLSKAIQFINSCNQLEVLSFQYEQYNNQLIVEINPLIIKQLKIIRWWSCMNLYKQKFTIPVLIKHCFSLINIVLIIGRRSKEYESVNEQMLINLITNNIHLQTIKFIGVNDVTDSLLETIFHHCKSIKSLIVFTKETHEECQLTLQFVYNFMWRTINSYKHINLNINGSTFGQLTFAQTTRERYYFKSLIVSQKIFHDLTQLSQAPVFKQINFTDRLLYKEDEFVLWCTNTVEI